MNQNKTEINDPICHSIDAEIESTREDIHRIIDFYSGAKTLNKPTVPRTETDDQRLLWTLRQLRERIEKLKKQRNQLIKSG